MDLMTVEIISVALFSRSGCVMTGLEAVAFNTVLHYRAHCEGNVTYIVKPS